MQHPPTYRLSSAAAAAHAPAIRALAKESFPGDVPDDVSDDEVLSALAGPFHDPADCEWSARERKSESGSQSHRGEDPPRRRGEDSAAPPR